MMENSEFASRINNGFFVGEHKPLAAKRIVSVVPSQTELLYDLGLDEEVIGITLFCVHPKQWHQSKPRIGGTKKLNINRIRELKPDLILANREENTKADIELLAKDFPIYVSEISNVLDAYDMIQDIGLLTNREQQAKALIKEINQTFSKIPTPSVQKSVCYLIWKNPYMTVGGDTFISAMIKEAGFINRFENEKRYPEISTEDMSKADFIFLSSEPFPFQEKHIREIQEQCPNSIVKLVDGELFSWYGSRMKYSADYFIQLNNELNGIGV